MKKIYLLLGLLFALSLGACSTGGNAGDTTSTGGSSVSNTESDTNSDTGSDTNSDTAGEHVHTWGEATYAWNGLECTAETVCTDPDCQEPLTETVTANYVKDTDATCYYNEAGHFEALFENDAFVDQITEANSAEQEDTMLAHSLTDVTYVWEEDVCTASTACTVDACGITITETVTATLVEDTAGDCYNNAKGHYEAVFESEYLATQKTEANGIEIPDSKKHQTETSLNEERRQIITACSLCGEEFEVENLYDTYADGDKLNGGANYVLPTPIAMSDLKGKALRFEFKFASETGSFGFQVMGLTWNRISEIVTITKTANDITANYGRIVEAGDGWYAWELNKSGFTGDGAAAAPTIDFIYPRNTVVGDLYIDWQSVSVVDEYVVDTRIEESTKYQNGEKLNGGANYVLPTPVPMAALSGKAVRFEFKFETETGSFAFSLLQYNPWTPLTNVVTITKTESGFTVTDAYGNKPCGRIVDAGDGWYAWELNAADFPTGTAAEAQVFDLIVPRNTVVGTLYLNWNSLAIVDAYANS